MKKRSITILFILAVVVMGAASCGYNRAGAKSDCRSAGWQSLQDSIESIVAEYPGEIGVALIINGSDTLTVNNENKYPMMSVFKLHQALALCHEFDRQGLSLDSMLTISQNELDPHTWSPMAREHKEQTFKKSVKDLLHYTLTQSDNNASNLMFRRLVDTGATDSYIATLIPRNSFRIQYTEAEMSADHSKAYRNSTSPLGAAMLMERLFTDSLVSPEKQRFIKQTLGECKTGNDRIAAPLIGREGVAIAHKTGSGYSENGVLAAHNDVAYVTLPDGRHYSLAVFVKDLHGDETTAAQAIARISATILTAITPKTAMVLSVPRLHLPDSSFFAIFVAKNNSFIYGELHSFSI